MSTLTYTPEMIVGVGRGIRLCYDRFGDTCDPPIVLIAGLGQQLHAWPAEFVGELVAKGFQVVRFDNRDCGRSTHVSFRSPEPLAMLRRGLRHHPYNLADMARDVVGLLDALGCRDAHLVGLSMGGMIAQTASAYYPGRVRTLTSISSTTGASRIGRPALSTWLKIATSRPPRNRDQAGDLAVRVVRHIGSHCYELDEWRLREDAAVAWDRDPTFDGVVRQFAAIVASGDRTAELARIGAPTLVVHGDKDRMVHPSGGAATARAIRGARLEVIRGLAHELPTEVWEPIADLITDHIFRGPITFPATGWAETS